MTDESAITPTVEDLYPPLQRSGDAVYDATGNMLPHWNYVMESLAGMPGSVLNDRQAKARRLLRDDGATYNIYTDNFRDKLNDSRTWGLDLIPNIISSDDWAAIESGLVERAELLNLLLRDIYGPRQLIRTGVIPPEVIYANRGFLRACQGLRMPGEHDLIIHAADMARGPDGNMMVLADRTQSPSGAGYALENRTVMSRVLPSLFRDSHVHRLAGYFRQLRSKMQSLCPHRPSPRIAVLTPGPRNETYFEHAYLANYLGFYLVQSDDLVVRGGFLWMKSLDGLSRVDVLMRRVDDWFCDPVELRGDSRLGVPGLLQVVRAGNLVVANSLGSGILESPALLKYLPDIGRALLGREPRLNSVQTWWCVNQYLPVLNNRVNHYLTLLYFNVKFNLDENFNETLKSRNHTEFSYTNFSAGERQRVDLALLFAWRDVAAMKNSVHSNLLILDEIGDSSMDERGIDDLITIIGDLKDTNLFVVSHRGSFEDKTRSVIRFEKVNGFTKMVT